MIVLPLTAVVLAHVLCLITSVTDIRKNRISNKLLLVFVTLGIILNIAQFIFKTHIIWNIYFFNLTLVIIFSLLLYILHIWAAGDSKLLIAMGLLIPANYCIINNKVIPWCVIVVAFSFGISFIYLIFESICLFIRDKSSFSLSNVKKNIKTFFISFLRNIVYISLVLKLENYFAREWFENHAIAMIGINISVILLVSSIKVLKKWISVVIALEISVVFSFFSGEWFFSISRLKYYILLIIVMLIRVMVSEYNYMSIPTSEVKKGMILSSLTTVFMTKSRIKNLPGISREDMRSRLTEEEAVAVVKWGNSKGGLKEVQIVRKIPYAIFIFIGLIIYSIIWGIFN
ncbi:preflagellin peptidase FlaK [Lachnospiraceae bacterium XPB1003]|nr:preflagellin peptidase FlaK [Lachnospiraceae bacterium XPB1003]